MTMVLALSALLALLPLVAHGERTWPTPEVTRIESFAVPGVLAYAMRGEVGDSDQYVGLALTCGEHGTRAAEVTAHFGAFPGKHHPVQLAVGSADGKVERFGPVVAAGPESGLHSPRVTGLHEAERFARAALQTGALISNGYRSFWNRANPTRNREVLEAFLACAKGLR